MRAKCNRDCEHCPYEDCINDGELDNAISCNNWYDRHKEEKRKYQREYARRKRAEKKNVDNNVKKICVICGSEIADKRAKKCCSYECRLEYRTRYMKQYKAENKVRLNEYQRNYKREERAKQDYIGYINYRKLFSKPVYE